MRDEHVGLAVDRGFQHHFVARVAQLGPPQKMKLDGLDNRGYVGHELRQCRSGVSGIEPELRTHQNRLVFEEERNRAKPRRPSPQQLDQQGIAGAPPRPQCRDDDIGVNDKTHASCLAQRLMRRKRETTDRIKRFGGCLVRTLAAQFFTPDLACGQEGGARSFLDESVVAV